jgi:2'-5' RNA ligase
MSHLTFPRKQLTLYLDAADAEVIEAVRRAYNPEQHRLIAAHVTLCRDDECGDEDGLKTKAGQLSVSAFSLRTGAMYRFADGKGLALELRDTQGAFRALRDALLPEGHKHRPHITLIHPRNATCTDRIYETIRELPFPGAVRIRSLTFIRQQEPQLPWTTEWNIKFGA